MLTRTRMTVLVAIGVLAAAGIVLSIIQLRRYDAHQAQATVPAPLAVGTALQRPRAVPAVTLRDQAGRPVSLTAWRGKWVVLAPSMTLCHEVCPMTTAVLGDLQERLGRIGLGRHVAVVEATVDPWRDSPARLQAYRLLTGARFPMLTGSQASIRRLWSFFGVYYKRVPQGNPPDVDWLTHRPESFDVQHTDAFFIIDPAGQERVLDQGMPSLAGARLSPTLHGLLNDQGVHNLAHPQLAWTAANVLEDLYYLMDRNLPASAVGPATPPSPAAAARALAGSPRPLADLHAQAGRLLPAGQSLRDELRSLRGYPVVLNAWASWCGPCKAEFPLLAAASARFGRQVAFLGGDLSDSAADAQSFLAHHPVSYPSYAADMQSLTWLAQIQGLPTTIFVGRDGRVAFVHTGVYQSQIALDQDIERHLLGI